MAAAGVSEGTATEVTEATEAIEATVATEDVTVTATGTMTVTTSVTEATNTDAARLVAGQTAAGVEVQEPTRTGREEGEKKEREAQEEGGTLDLSVRAPLYHER